MVMVYHYVWYANNIVVFSASRGTQLLSWQPTLYTALT